MTNNMQPNKVTIRFPKARVEGFVAYCRAFPETEKVVLLVGLVEGHEVTITDLVYPTQEGTEERVWFDPDELDRIAQEAEPYRIIGSIHSQPDSDASPSEEDILTASACGEVVFGIVGLQNGEAKLAWYVGMPMIEAIGL